MRRPLVWEGSAKRDFKQFPIAVQKDMGVALFVAQLGGTPPSAKPWKGVGPGVFELVEDHRGDTYRAIYTVRIEASLMCCTPSRRNRSQGSRPQGRTSSWSSAG